MSKCHYIYKSGDICPHDKVTEYSESYCHQHVIHEKWWPECTICKSNKVAYYTTDDRCHFCIEQGRDPHLTFEPTTSVDLIDIMDEHDFPALGAKVLVSKPAKVEPEEDVTAGAFGPTHYAAVQTALEKLDIEIDDLSPATLDQAYTLVPDDAAYDMLWKYTNGDYSFA